MAFVRLGGHRAPLQAPVAPDTIEAVCREALGSAARLTACEHVPHGQFNTTYRLGFAAHAPLILRVAPPSNAPLFRHERGLLAREFAVHRCLAAASDAIPRIVHHDFSCATIARPLLLLECRPGVVWDHIAAEIAEEDTHALWREFGTQVRAIHAVEGELFGFPCADEGRRSHADWLLGLFADLAADLDERKLLVPGLTGFRQRLHAGHAALEAPAPPRLVHGDLWLQNVLVERRAGRWRISAILDAERAFWSEPAAEWIFSHLRLPPAFWQAYGAHPIAGAGDRSARLRVLAYRARAALQLILEGWRRGTDTAFAERNFATCVDMHADLHEACTCAP